MTSDEAWELGDETGFNDGYDGNSYNSCNDTVPAELTERYRVGYRHGFYAGQAAYRRTIRW